MQHPPRWLSLALGLGLTACNLGPAPAPPPRTVLDPGVVVRILLADVPLAPHDRVQVALDPGGLAPAEEAALRAQLEAALAERLGAQALDVSTPEARFGLAFMVAGVAEPGGALVRWRLLDVTSGAVRAVVRQDTRGLLAPSLRGDDPLQLTQSLLQAARHGQGGPIAAALHPELARRWRREAQAAGRDLPGYALLRLGPLSKVRLREMEYDPGATRAEVEVEVEGKLRDVDFQWRREGGRWLLRAVGDL